MECMFRVEGGGERVKPQLEEHLRQRGYGKWVSASCSPSGSYKLQDILSFLERHLPYQTEDREWRIIMADDHAPHVSPSVAKLCWSRGYVFVPHGGGVTPVVQVLDTELNQFAKRKYMAIEGAAFFCGR